MPKSKKQKTRKQTEDWRRALAVEYQVQQLSRDLLLKHILCLYRHLHQGPPRTITDLFWGTVREACCFGDVAMLFVSPSFAFAFIGPKMRRDEGMICEVRHVRRLMSGCEWSAERGKESFSSGECAEKVVHVVWRCWLTRLILLKPDAMESSAKTRMAREAPPCRGVELITLDVMVVGMVTDSC